MGVGAGWSDATASSDWCSTTNGGDSTSVERGGRKERRVSCPSGQGVAGSIACSGNVYPANMDRRLSSAARSLRARWAWLNRFSISHVFLALAVFIQPSSCSSPPPLHLSRLACSPYKAAQGNISSPPLLADADAAHQHVPVPIIGLSGGLVHNGSFVEERKDQLRTW